MTPKEFKRTAVSLIKEQLTINRRFNLERTAEQLLNLSGTISGDIEFALYCIRKYIWEELKKLVEKFNAERADRQEVFKGGGFTELLEAYPMPLPDGSHDVILIDDLTKEQILGRAHEYEVHGDGSYEHARQLRLYLKLREQGGGGN